MRTSARLVDTTLFAYTETQTFTWLGGFTGGVRIILLNAGGGVIYLTQERTYGVDGTWFGSGLQQQEWQEDIPPDIVSQCKALAVTHYWAPRVDIIGVLIVIGKAIWELIEQMQNQKDAGEPVDVGPPPQL
jgi:hypothetical protein